MKKEHIMQVNRIIERILLESDSIVLDAPLKKQSLYDLLYDIAKKLGVPNIFLVDSKKAEYVPEGLFDIIGECIDNKISITIIFNPNDGEVLQECMKLVVWHYYKGMIFDTLSHEFMHFYQNTQRAEKGTRSDQRLVTKMEYKSIKLDDSRETGLYLLNPDEIEAHAYNASSQMYRRYGSLAAALYALKKGKYCETIDYYREYISTTHRPYKRFIRKVVKFLVDKYSETIADSTSEQSEVDSTAHVDDNKE